MLRMPGRSSAVEQELVFLASDLAPLGFTTFFVHKNEEVEEDGEEREEREEEYSLGQAGGLRVLASSSSPSLRVIDPRRGVDLPVEVEALYYRGHRGNNSEFEFRASGAYIFRPEKGGAVGLGGHTDTLVQGPVVDELVRTYADADWLTLAVRVYHSLGQLEVAWLAGPLPTGDGVGKELILRYTSSEIASGTEFQTDSLGRQLLTRVRDYRPTFEINQTEPEAQNYYPVATNIIIQDDSHQMAVLPDRPQGGSSLASGSLELMLHRRLLDDDAFGVGEPLDEEAFGCGLVAAGRHRLLLHSDPESMAEERRLAAIELYSAPLVVLGRPPALPPCSPGSLPAQIHLLRSPALPSIQFWFTLQ
jgi:lysosomal alpha-mannosidase